MWCMDGDMHLNKCMVICITVPFNEALLFILLCLSMRHSYLYYFIFQ